MRDRNQRRVFLGRNDGNRVTLNRVFPDSDIVFSMPLIEVSRYPRVVIQGCQGHLLFVEPQIRELTLRADIAEPAFGRWVGFQPYDPADGRESIELYYDPLDRPWNRLQLLVCTLRSHLIRICDFRLADVADLILVLNDRIIMHAKDPLPPAYGNGSVKLPPPDQLTVLLH